MTTNAETVETSPAATPVGTSMGRLLPLDALRGLIIVVMALDHANAFIAHAHPPPEIWNAQPTRPADALAFLTRFVTHLAAPGFFFLMGAGMVLFATSRRRQGWAEAAILRHLMLRGLLLIALQLLVENPAWQLGTGPIFTPQVFFSYFGVLYGLGAAMIAGSLLLRLRPAALIGLGLAATLATELAISGVRRAGIATAPWAQLLMIPGRASGFTVYYPLIPWLGVALFGMAFGAWLARRSDSSIREGTRSHTQQADSSIHEATRSHAKEEIKFEGLRAFWHRGHPGFADPYRGAAYIGLALLALFAALRLIGGFGNLQPPAQGWIGFLNVIKYPPSIVFLCLTLGIDLLLLALLGRADDRPPYGRSIERPNRRPPGLLLRSALSVLAVFGGSPLFFYIAHLYLYGLIGMALGPGGTGIPRMYPFWLLGLAILYPLCWLYGRFKRGRGPDSLWRLL